MGGFFSKKAISPIWDAIENDDVELLCKLLYKIDPNNKELHQELKSTPLHKAVRKGNIQIIQLLLKAHANPNNMITGTSSLHDAVRKGDLPVVKLLVASGADVNQQNEYGQAALSFIDQDANYNSQYKPNYEMINYLINSGADPWAKVISGNCSASILINTAINRTLIKAIEDAHSNFKKMFLDDSLANSDLGMRYIDSQCEQKPNSYDRPRFR